jgi:hypothetical protein
MESNPFEADTGSAKLQGLKWLCCRCVSGPPTPSSEYPHLDPILTGAIKAHRITSAWDEVVRLVASMSSRVVSPSLVLLRLGSYARQNRIHQALAEIGRIHKTVHILRTLDNEEYRQRMGRELNKGEASHELSRFLCFGKEGELRGREFGDQLHTFSCLSVLHNAVVAWNMVHIEPVVEQLRAEGQRCDDELLSLTTPLLRRHQPVWPLLLRFGANAPGWRSTGGTPVGSVSFRTRWLLTEVFGWMWLARVYRPPP